jgi:hypothetical protein
MLILSAFLVIEASHHVATDIHLCIQAMKWGENDMKRKWVPPWSFRRTSYRPMMTILASRERFCLHPDIATAPNKTEACEGATMVGHMDCSYLENAEASWYPQVLRCSMQSFTNTK